MTSDGLGSCNIKQKMEGKENWHLEQSQDQVNCSVTHQGNQSWFREVLRREMDQVACAAEFASAAISTHLLRFCIIVFLFVSYFFLFFIVVQVQLSPFSCHSLLPHPSAPPTLAFGFVHVSFIHVP